jgi:prolyl-tRNA synthetase
LMAESADKAGKKTTRAIVALMRGDHQLNEAKLNAIVGAATRPMEETEILALFNSPAGYLGPLGIVWAKDLKGIDAKDSALPVLLLDKALEGRKNLIAGANKENYHTKNLTPGKDFAPTAYADLRTVTAGEACPNCGTPLRIDTAVEIGHIFKLGYRYTKSMGSSVLNRDGKETTPIMGCYGIGIERILTAAIESSAAANDGSAYALHPSIAPFQVVVTVTNIGDAALLAAGEKVAADLTAAGLDVLLDDRDERAGVKFKDSDLVGIPYRINIGRGVAEGKVELVDRLQKLNQDVAIDQIASTVANQITSALQTQLSATAV